MSWVRDAGRAVVRPLRVLGLGLWWLLRLIWRGLRRSGRALRGSPSGLSAEQQRRRSQRLQAFAWFLAVVFGCIAFGTAQFTYEISLGLAPFVGALVGLPFGVIAVRPLLGWALSVGGAALLIVTLPLTNAIPWPWQVMHGLVILALLAAVCA